MPGVRGSSVRTRARSCAYERRASRASRHPHQRCTHRALVGRRPQTRVGDPLVREGKELVARRITELDRLSDDELRQFEPNPVDEIVTARSGKRFRVQVEASTDGRGEYDDEPELSVTVRATGLGLATWQRYAGGIGRHESVQMKRFSGPEGVTSTWSDTGSLLLVVGFLLATVGIWIVGAVYLLVLLTRLIF